jgi:diguanylate cyclase (GGDEF)-like protein/PAS domain S-box-containing protein
MSDNTIPAVPVKQVMDDEMQLLSLAFATSSEGIMITDPARRIVLINRRFSEITGYAADEVIGKTPALLSSGVHDASFYQAMQRALESQGKWAGEITNRRKDGTLYPEWLTISVLKDDQGQVKNYVGLFSDLTQHKLTDDRVQQLMNYDALTSLPNRALFLDRLEQSLRSAFRTGENAAVFWIDLLRLRVINESFGQTMGDVVLAETGHRIAQAIRDNDTVARLSSDEFGVLMLGYDREKDIILLAKRLLEAIVEPIPVGESSCVVSSNIGISVFRKDGLTAEELLKAADVALARAKESGRDTFRFFATGMDRDAERRLHLEGELTHALERGQISLAYQPQIDLTTGRINAIEALMRWHHPELGNLGPTEFIPVAEEIGVMQTLGAWAIGEACRQNKVWIDGGIAPLPVAVNISGKQFYQGDLAGVVAHALTETGLPSHLLELEFTESAFSGDLVAAAAIVKSLREQGITLVLDDFGSGYSSLASLSGFPFQKIKIDRSFVHDITTNPVNAAIATASIAMARSLNLVILAEGVETEAQMQFLRGRQCEAMQGHLFSEALPVDQMERLLTSQRMLKVNEENEPVQQTLLLVDDEVNILNALKRVLRREGYQVLTAENTDLAFELLAKFPVQVIISDQRMPGMSGTAFLERAKRLYPDTVRIILSGYTDLASITDAINRGAIYHFLTKPWEDDKLRAEVREAFRVAQGFARA